MPPPPRRSSRDPIRRLFPARVRAIGQDGPCARSRNTRQWYRAAARPPEESVPLAAAHGRVLARDVAAEVALPGFDNSAMDGYAARWAESARAQSPVRLPVAEDIPAGRTDVVPLAPGTVHRIMTGARCPPGADVVVPVELTDGGTDVVEIRDSPAARHPPARAGEDIAAGHRRPARPAPRSAPRSSGWPPPSGSRPCRCAAGPGCWSCPPAASWSRPGEPLLPGQIYESNSQLLVAAVEDAGGEARRLHFVPDDVDQFLATVRAEVATADLLITSGGVSAGAYEVVKDAFRGLGTVEFAKVGDAAGRSAGRRHRRRRPGGHPAGQPGQRVRLLRGLRPPGAAAGAGVRLPRPPARARPADRAAALARRDGASSCAAATTAARSPRSAGPAPTWSPTSPAPTAWSSSPRTSPNCPPAPRSTSC